MSVGFSEPLYRLPLTHRGSFATKMFGWEGPLTLLAVQARAHVLAAASSIRDGGRELTSGDRGNL